MSTLQEKIQKDNQGLPRPYRKTKKRLNQNPQEENPEAKVIKKIVDSQKEITVCNLLIKEQSERLKGGREDWIGFLAFTPKTQSYTRTDEEVGADKQKLNEGILQYAHEN